MPGKDHGFWFLMRIFGISGTLHAQ
jgi:hypothetical protein